MPMPDAKMYAMKKESDGTIIGYCQGWPWMIPPMEPGIILEEVTSDGLPPYTPPGPDDTLPPQKT